MKRKLAIIIPSLRGGGAERVIVNIVRNIDYSKFDVRLILIKKEGTYLDLIPKNITLINLNADRARYSILALVKELNNFEANVILSTLGHLNLILLAIRRFLKGSPKIIVREANTPSKSMSELSSSKKMFFSYLYKKLYPKADLIIAQCRDMRNDIIDTFNVDKEKIKYIYNPLDLERIMKDREGTNPYDVNKINFLSVGRLTYQKGFDILLNAFKIVIEKLPEAHLTILGEGDRKKELQKQANQLRIGEKISIVGFKDNPYPYYYYSDMYVLSSRWEGFPNTLLEALACGTKVIAMDCKSGPREIIGDNEYGILVKEGDYVSLAEGMIKYISEENKTKDRADYFNVNRVIRDYEEVLLS